MITKGIVSLGVFTFSWSPGYPLKIWLFSIDKLVRDLSQAIAVIKARHEQPQALDGGAWGGFATGHHIADVKTEMEKPQAIDGGA